jgi:hypothetical protein
MSRCYILFSAPDIDSYLKRQGEIIFLGPKIVDFDGDWHARYFPHHAQPMYHGYQAFSIFEPPISVDGKLYYYAWELGGAGGADFQVFVHENTTEETKQAIRKYINHKRDALSISFYTFSTITYMSKCQV